MPPPPPRPLSSRKQVESGALKTGKIKVALGGVANVYLWNELLLFDTFTFPVKILKMVL